MTPAWSEDMMKNWSEAQKRYWDAWSQLATMGQSSAAAQPEVPAWTAGLEQWWKAVNQHMTPGASTDAFQRVVDMGKTYMNLAENAFNVQQSDVVGADAMNAWMDAMESCFRGYCGQLDMGKMATHGFGVGQAAADSWQRVLKSMGMQAFQEMGAGGFHMPTSEHWQEQLSKMLATPAIGFNRESQERLQDLVQLGVNYQEASDEYLKAFAKQGLESVEALRARVTEMQEKGTQLQSLRELYDLWVDVNEEVYGKFAMSDEYQVVYGDMVNALMTLKQGINAQMDDTYKAANLPTRNELNAAFEKQQELRRENRALRKELKALARKVDALAAGKTEAKKPATRTRKVAAKPAAAKPATVAAKKPATTAAKPAATKTTAATEKKPATTTSKTSS